MHTFPLIVRVSALSLYPEEVGEQHLAFAFGVSNYCCEMKKQKKRGTGLYEVLGEDELWHVGHGYSYIYLVFPWHS